MSGRLKSPPRMKYEDWYCDLTVVMSFTSGSMYSPSVLLGGLYAADMMSFDCFSMEQLHFNVNELWFSRCVLLNL